MQLHHRSSKLFLIDLEKSETRKKGAILYGSQNVAKTVGALREQLRAED